MSKIIDINEEELKAKYPDVFDLLLLDRTTGRNIVWATDNYIDLGSEYSCDRPIMIELITGKNNNVIQPRVSKSKNEQFYRTKDKGEVFTPSWVCNEQNNVIDKDWFDCDSVYMTDNNGTIIPSASNIVFLKDRNWEEYVLSTRLEACCGEAPYVTSRYDTVSGNSIDIDKRVGILDRKLRVVNENTVSGSEWIKWAKISLENTYAFEYQGDNLFLARENVLLTVMENYKYKFDEDLSPDTIKSFADVISWNFWQMDGESFTTPYSKNGKKEIQLSLFDDKIVDSSEPALSLIYDWKAGKAIKFKSLLLNRYMYCG